MILEVSLDKTRELGVVVPRRRCRSASSGRRARAWPSAASNAAKTLYPGGAALTETMLAGAARPGADPDEAPEPRRRSTATLDIPSFGVLIRRCRPTTTSTCCRTRTSSSRTTRRARSRSAQHLPFPVSRSGWAAAAAPGGAAPGRASAGSPASARNVQREDVALKLKLTPHVNEHDMVRLEVDQEISDARRRTSSSLGPVDLEAHARRPRSSRKDQQTS